MALLGPQVAGEVGLRLLLCPFGSNIVVRTACCSVGIALPVYSTFKAIENKDQKEQEKWLLYWAVYGSFSLVEAFADKILYWFPLYYHMKFAFFVWLQLPTVEGAKQLYLKYLRPFLLKYQRRLDQILVVVSGEMRKFISAHQGEIQFMGAMVQKSVGAVRHMLTGPTQQCDQTAPRGRQIRETDANDDD